MKAIIAHPNLDFDALASMVAAQKLYPDAVLVTVGKLGANVREFIVMHGDFIDIRNYIDKKDIDTLIMVDTRSHKRLLDFGKALENEDLKVIVYDHHESADDDVPGAEIYYEPLGANITQLVERIKDRNIEITPQEATVFALGIYDDTGSLRYPSTTVRDLEAAAWLLSKGASLTAISEYTTLALGADQNELLAELLQNSEIKTIHERDVLISSGTREMFINGLSSLTVRIKDVYSVDAVFLVVRMENRIYIVGRSSTKEINVRAALASYGGRGHLMAASAMLKEPLIPVTDITAALFKTLGEIIAPPLMVEDVMTAPVKTVDAQVTVNEIGEYMLRYGHSGYPVMENGKLIGIISRRDVEKCKYHGLGNVPVKGYMSHRVATVSADMTAVDARELMIRENVGRLPVMDGEALVGIVTRTDLLQLLYGHKVGNGHQLTYTKNTAGEESVNLLQALEKTLPAKMFQVLGQISALADAEGLKVFLVGGLVRDLLMGKRSVDLDIVVEGDGIAFAKSVASLLSGELSAYPKFGTATVVVAGVIKIDIAGARTEFYEYPAAKPTVAQGSLKQDLFRRDFTVNAMALSLNEKTFGQLIDYYNGREDLLHEKIRVLHNLSFVEDPTRILRALRFSVRYGFTMTPETEKFALKAIEDGTLNQLSRRRIWHETELALKERCAYEILELMYEFKIWGVLFPNVAFDFGLKADFAEIAAGFDLSEKIKYKFNLPLLRFLVLVFPFGEDDLNAFFEEAQIPRSYRDSAGKLKALVASTVAAAEDFTAVGWYRIIDETSLDVLAAASLKMTPLWKERLFAAIDFYQKYKIVCTRNEIRGLDGYQRGQLEAILNDLLHKKQKGTLQTKEDELAYIGKNLKNGKYKGDLNV